MLRGNFQGLLGSTPSQSTFPSVPRTRARLNGRKAQDLIDPNVNLAAEASSLWPAPWIVPLTEPFRSSRED